MLRRRAFISSLLLLVSAPLWAADSDGRARVKDGLEFDETLRAEAPVSGRVVASVIAHSDVAADIALLRPISERGESVCVQVLSRDGRYTSRNTFVVPGGIDASAVPLDYPSVHRDFLSGLGPDGLAILATAGECGDGPGETIYAAATQFRLNPAAPEELTILVNSGRSDVFVAVRGDPNMRRPARCRRLEDGRRTAFDTSCIVDLSKLESRPRVLSLRILMRRYERSEPPLELRIVLPPAR